jgi:chloramphenicol-sensitive protein RarD
MSASSAPAPTPAQQTGDTLPGFLYALTAYFLWGFLPIYMKALAHVPPSEVVAHRILWSVPIAGLIILVRRRTADLRAALCNPRMLAMAALTAAIISVNWGVYVWAIGSGHALDAALGYYINPLFSVFLGAVFLKEKLKPLQVAAILLAVVAVALLTWAAGRLPLVALTLTVSWAAYAYCKRTLPIGPNQGFFLEVLLLSPFALGWLLWLGFNGTGHFPGTPGDMALLAGTGLVTALPLMIYANGAKLLRLSTIGMMQYIAPTMIFLTAVFVFGEPFDRVKLYAFALIWTALAIYTASMLRQARAAR